MKEDKLRVVKEEGLGVMKENNLDNELDTGHLLIFAVFGVFKYQK